MRKKCFWVFAAIVISGFISSSAWADVRNVRSNCTGLPNCYTTISAAVAASSGGDEIHIYPGIYNESVNLSTMAAAGNISLITVNASGSPDSGTATIRSEALGVSPLYNSDPFAGNITVTGLILQSAPLSTGNDAESGLIFEEVRGNITLTDLDVTSSSWDGIALFRCTGDVNIDGCIANGCYDDGFSVGDLDDEAHIGNVTITDCTATGNREDGFQVAARGNIEIRNCLAENHLGKDDDEDGFELAARGNINVEDCTARNNAQEGIDVIGCGGDATISGCTVQGNGGEGIDTDFLTGTSLRIEECRILSNSGQGIQIAEEEAANGSVTISCCDIDGNGEGIHLYQAILVEAINNWWGHSSGPLDTIGNPLGMGDSVVITPVGGQVIYDPWLNTSFARSITCGAPQSIPATTPMGMTIMIIIMASAALWLIQRRQNI